MKPRRVNNPGTIPSGMLVCKRGQVMATVLSRPFDLMAGVPASIVRALVWIKEALPPSRFSTPFKSEGREATTVKVHLVNSSGKIPNGGLPYRRGQVKTALFLWAFGLMAAVTRSIVAVIVRMTGEKEALSCCNFAATAKS